MSRDGAAASRARLPTTTAAAVAVLAASTALAPLVAGSSWVAPVVVVVLLVAVLGALTRAAGLPAVGPVLQAWAVWVVAAAVGAPGTAAGAGLLPGPESWRVLVEALTRAVEVVDAQPAPVDAVDGVVVVLVVVVGLVAVVVDGSAATLHAPLVAGLPLLLVVVSSTALLEDGLGPWPPLLTAAAFLALLAGDAAERRQAWGPSVTRVPGAARAATAGGVAVGAGVLALALVAGLAAPAVARTGSSTLADGEGFGLADATGRSVTTFDPLVEVRPQLVDLPPTRLALVDTDDPEPGYLRMAVLEDYDGERWSMRPLRGGDDDRVDGGLPEAAGRVDAVASVRSEARVQSLGLQVPWLPLFADPAEVDVEGYWVLDRPSRVVFSARTDTLLRTWTQQVDRPVPTAGQLRAAAADPLAGLEDPGRALGLPDVGPQVQELADRLVGGAATPFDAALAVQDHLRSEPFTYSLDPPQGNGEDALEDFLLRTRSGYCEQYAASMAVLLRAGGVPARVAVGFKLGGRTEDGAYEVTTRQAHAWPEVYLPGSGWLQFEPTPSSGGGISTPAYAESATGGDTPDSGTPDTDTATAGATGTDGLTAPAGGPDAGAPPPRDEDPAAGPDIGDDRPGAVASAADAARALGVVLLVGALVAAPWAVRRLRQARRVGAADPRARVHGAWREVEAAALDTGVRLPVSAGVRTAAELVATAGAGLGATGAVRRLAALEERARYSPGSPVDDEVDQVAEDVARVRQALLASLGAGARLRATLLPPSLLADVRGGLGAVTGGDPGRADGNGTDLAARDAPASPEREARGPGELRAAGEAREPTLAGRP